MKGIAKLIKFNVSSKKKKKVHSFTTLLTETEYTLNYSSYLVAKKGTLRRIRYGEKKNQAKKGYGVRHRTCRNAQNKHPCWVLSIRRESSTKVHPASHSLLIQFWNVCNKRHSNLHTRSDGFEEFKIVASLVTTKWSFASVSLVRWVESFGTSSPLTSLTKIMWLAVMYLNLQRTGLKMQKEVGFLRSLFPKLSKMQ